MRSVKLIIYTVFVLILTNCNYHDIESEHVLCRLIISHDLCTPTFVIDVTKDGDIIAERGQMKNNNINYLIYSNKHLNFVRSDYLFYNDSIARLGKPIHWQDELWLKVPTTKGHFTYYIYESVLPVKKTRKMSTDRMITLKKHILNLYKNERCYNEFAGKEISDGWYYILIIGNKQYIIGNEIKNRKKNSFTNIWHLIKILTSISPITINR